MTGAGSAEVAFADEDSFATLPGVPTWYQPGEDIQVTDYTLVRNLQRKRKPDDPRPTGSREGNREVAFSISFSLTDTNWHDMAFANGGTGLAQSGSLAPTASWYLKSDTLPGTEERFIQGGAVESFTVNYNQGEDITVDLMIIGGREYDAGDGSAPSVPGTINQPSKDDIATFAGASFDLNGSQLSTKLQSFNFTVSGAARFRRGQQQEAVDAVVGAYEPSFNVTAILEDSTQRELAYGTSGTTAPQDTVDTSSGTITIDNPAGTLTTYSLVDLQPTNYEWADLVSADTDITEPTEYHATDITVS